MIQIDIPMPEHCDACPLETFYTGSGETRCKALHITLASDYKPIPYDCRPKFCPLVEVEYYPVGEVVEDDMK